MIPLTDTIVAIKGAGEMGSAIAWRLYMANIRKIIMMDRPRPMAVRRHVCFCEAIPNGQHNIDGVSALYADQVDAIRHAWSKGRIAVAADPSWKLIPKLTPNVVVDAILAKQNLGTTIDEAPLVIGLGPGFQAPRDVHAVVETNRGHDLGRIITRGCAAPNTGIPGKVNGFSHQRVIRSPANGIFEGLVSIGDVVSKGDIIAKVGPNVLPAELDGIVRGLVRPNLRVKKGDKLGDIDPRNRREHCFSISDKARAISGSVLEAILRTFPATLPN
jgi:xanthine dehydrogenase accessory factor